MDNAPFVNAAKAGSTIPLKFSLSGNRGMGIIASGYPRAHQVSCSPTDPIAPVEDTTNSSSGLTYDPVADRYRYDWKTPKNYAGSCYRFESKLVDERSGR